MTKLSGRTPLIMCPGPSWTLAERHRRLEELVGWEGRCCDVGPQHCPPGRACYLSLASAALKAGNFSQGAPGENGAVWDGNE